MSKDKINITIDPDILAMIDKAADKERRSRSQMIEEIIWPWFSRQKKKAKQEGE